MVDTSKQLYIDLDIMQGCKRRRAGCTECRRKKAKCDEKWPVCSRCSKFPQLCSYELNIKRKQFQKQTADQVSTGNFKEAQQAACEASCSNLELVSPVLLTYRLTDCPMVHSDTDRFYLHHFIAHTSIVYFPLQPETALSLVIPTAQNSPCMLGALLAASCSHYSRLTDNENARTAALAATVGTLSTLRETIMTPTTRSQSSAILSTMLLLATTCVCGGDTGAFRKHLNAALHIVQQHRVPHSSDALWRLSLKWLVHLLLMNRLSGSPLNTEQRQGCFDWDQSLESMPDFGQIDVITGLSRDLVTILKNVCELSDLNRPTQDVVKHHTQLENSGINRDLDYKAREVSARSLETRLLKLEDITTSLTYDLMFQTELECCHSMYTNATLLCLYRRVDELPKTHPKVQIAVEFIIQAVQKIDKYSRANIQLLWPLLTAGCEAITDAQRSVVLDRMTAMSSRGLGSYNTMLRFMKDYWKNGGDSRWDVFSRRIGMDLVLF